MLPEAPISHFPAAALLFSRCQPRDLAFPFPDWSGQGRAGNIGGHRREGLCGFYSSSSVPSGVITSHQGPQSRFLYPWVETGVWGPRKSSTHVYEALGVLEGTNENTHLLLMSFPPSPGAAWRALQVARSLQWIIHPSSLPLFPRSLRSPPIMQHLM